MRPLAAPERIEKIGEFFGRETVDSRGEKRGIDLAKTGHRIRQPQLVLRFGICVPRLELRDDQFTRQSLQIAQVNGTARPRLFCTASSAVATCRRRLRRARPQPHYRSRIQSSSGLPGHSPADRMDAPGLAQHRLLNRRAALRRYEPHCHQILPR